MVVLGITLSFYAEALGDRLKKRRRLVIHIDSAVDRVSVVY